MKRYKASTLPKNVGGSESESPLTLGEALRSVDPTQESRVEKGSATQLNCLCSR